MDKTNKLYENQGIHVICSIFTVEKGVTKVLLIKRKNEPYKDMWALVGGALYNNEEVIDGLNREIYEKTGIENIKLFYSDLFSNIKRSPLMRMIALSYIGIVDFEKISYLKDTLKTSDAKLFSLDEIPNLAYDHNDILNKSITTLKEKIVGTDILDGFFPNGFFLPELQMVYEAVLKKTFDRRNFRKKLILDKIVLETGALEKFNGKKPAKLYKINTNLKGDIDD